MGMVRLVLRRHISQPLGVDDLILFSLIRSQRWPYHAWVPWPVSSPQKSAWSQHLYGFIVMLQAWVREFKGLWQLLIIGRLRSMIGGFWSVLNHIVIACIFDRVQICWTTSNFGGTLNYYWTKWYPYEDHYATFIRCLLLGSSAASYS